MKRRGESRSPLSQDPLGSFVILNPKHNPKVRVRDIATHDGEALCSCARYARTGDICSQIYFNTYPNEYMQVCALTSLCDMVSCSSNALHLSKATRSLSRTCSTRRNKDTRRERVLQPDENVSDRCTSYNLFALLPTSKQTEECLFPPMTVLTPM